MATIHVRRRPGGHEPRHGMRDLIAALIGGHAPRPSRSAGRRTPEAGRSTRLGPTGHTAAVRVLHRRTRGGATRPSGHGPRRCRDRALRCATFDDMRVVSSMGLRVPTGGRLLGLAAIPAVFAIVCLAPTACGVAPSAYGLLLAPAFALFAILLLGCAPGARLLERLRARRFARRAPRAPRTLAMRRAGRRSADGLPGRVGARDAPAAAAASPPSARPAGPARGPARGPATTSTDSQGRALARGPSQGIRDPRTTRVATHGRSDHEQSSGAEGTGARRARAARTRGGAGAAAAQAAAAARAR